ncbi:hypothetical protein [Halomonas elongata]|uniref:Membrane-associated protein n=1 Tax=Halomonas elongata (strain ATCC 33173 / DSM 2581 / NBRC 15536 / NCIMB 2198 / 1H9) TaxID=768066 RepID=E1VB79_HALED|nr:hypothetical protein [Halomonas elongata]MBW5798830.1 hypothetical protein [Halomonas elongata]WBF19409.1 hypothetical protein LM502_06875 [Halomonas elongata]WPU48269.1 hypothetical protein SR933_05100 [Halomonas elongata DSM 2581]CBV42140.1 uncharacterized protein HELO_2256 [Halomonas elongata DSM 2581]
MNVVQRGRLPLWLKVAFTLWILFWAPAVATQVGIQNYLWLCNLANFLLLAGLWAESRLIISMQWLATALVGSLWALDAGVAWVSGWHPIGGTEYMFDVNSPLGVRLLSLYHLILPLVAGVGVARLGYAPRALVWQTLLTWLAVPAAFLLTEPWRNVNWVHGPFGAPQNLLDPVVYLIGLMLAWPLLLYLPVHLVTRWLSRRTRR